nr:MAG TPA: putative transcriptional regulator [Caudoviricetes sp.]
MGRAAADNRSKSDRIAELNAATPRAGSAIGKHCSSSSCSLAMKAFLLGFQRGYSLLRKRIPPLTLPPAGGISFAPVRTRRSLSLKKKISLLTISIFDNILSSRISNIDKRRLTMAREKFSTLTEQMFYILLCLREECCGMDVMARVNELTGGRVAVGPGTLYNLLEQFLAAGYIVETRAEGRRRSYQLTAEGKTLLQNEVERLQAQVRDYEKLFER